MKTTVTFSHFGFSTKIFEKFSLKRILVVAFILLSVNATFAELNSGVPTVVYNNPPNNGVGIVVTGWAYDSGFADGTGAPLEIYVDGVLYQKDTCNITRDDVVNWYNDHGGAYTNNMLGYSFNLSSLDFSVTHHVDIEMVRSDGAGTATAYQFDTQAQTPSALHYINGQSDVKISSVSNSCEFRISANELTILSVSVLNIQGKTIYKSANADALIDLSTMPKGVYIFNINTNKSTFVKKIIL